MVNVALSPFQVNLVVRDIERSIAFYRLLGWEVGEPTGQHVNIPFTSGVDVDLDQHEFAQQWNRGTPGVGGGGMVLCVSTRSREEVDEIHTRMVEARYDSRQVPYDAFWGSRFAVIADPDGNQIGLMSPSQPAHRRWPPTQAPDA